MIIAGEGVRESKIPPPPAPHPREDRFATRRGRPPGNAREFQSTTDIVSPTCLQINLNIQFRFISLFPARIHRRGGRIGSSSVRDSALLSASRLGQRPLARMVVSGWRSDVFGDLLPETDGRNLCVEKFLKIKEMTRNLLLHHEIPLMCEYSIDRVLIFHSIPMIQCSYLTILYLN